MIFYSSCTNCLGGRGHRGKALLIMKFNDEYDSERHMELVGKYTLGRKRKVLTCEVFGSRISL